MTTETSSTLHEFTIIGAGRIGQMFASVQAQSPKTSIKLLRRGETTIAPSGPILLCSRNDDLQAIIEFIPAERHVDLIFVQNGMLQTWLSERQLQNATQALLYVAVSKIGDKAVDGGRSVVTGKHAPILCLLMQKLGLSCRECETEEFLKEMVEKFLWNCSFGLLCQHFNMSVGAVIAKQSAISEALILEQLTICQNALGVSFSSSETASMIQRLFDYSLSISDYRGAVKEWPWRNGWLVAQSSDTESLHHRLLSQIRPIL
jgi:ketopantoate reductase